MKYLLAPTTLAQPFSKLLLTPFVAISAPDSALLVLLADAVSESFRLVADEPAYIMLPAPPLPTWYTGAMASCCLICLSSSSSKEKMARSELWWTLPAPPRPDLKLVGCLYPREEHVVEADVVKGFKDEGLTIFPAPPRAV
jgi:hypothetical protein